MYLTVKQQIKHLSKNDFKIIRKLTHIAKNLTNEALYNIRQHYFENKKYLNYFENYKILKHSENYKKLNSNMAQQILKEVDGSFKSFFELIKMAKRGEYDFSNIKMPDYLAKDGYTTLVISMFKIKNNTLTIPYSRSFSKKHNEVVIKIPPILNDKEIKEIRIIPKCNARFFEIQYTYKVIETQRKINNNKALAIDFGINNLATCVTNDGKTFIVDGKKLKSINQWYNKHNAHLQSIKDKQKYKGITKKQCINTLKRNNRINDYLNKTSHIIIDYCLNNKINVIVCGYNNSFQTDSNLGKENNQKFKNIPFGKLLSKLKYMCELNGLKFIVQEESYTSKSSFFDNDEIPVYSKDNIAEYTFSGKRIKRGLYKTKDGKILNADINGALNILRKSNVVSLNTIYARGEVDTPVRIRIQ